MSELSDLRITDEDIAQHGVIAAPDRLTGSAAENKAIFDRLVRDALKERFNTMLETVGEHLVWEPYDAGKAYVPGNKVVHNGSSYLCTAACTGVLPTNAAHWRLIAARGMDGSGVGDMRMDIYDPRHIEADVFTYVDERTDTFDKNETLSAATARSFVDNGVSATAPKTPNEAFTAIAASAKKTELVTEIIERTSYWVAPSGIDGQVRVIAFGAGGNGATTGYGGGAGGEAETKLFTPVPGKKYRVTVGEGSSAPTSFDTIVTANGGAGGSGVNGGSGGSGGGGGGNGGSNGGSGGNATYGGGGGGSSGYTANHAGGTGGNGGTYGGGGGGGNSFTAAAASGGKKGTYGGAGGKGGNTLAPTSLSVAGNSGTNTSSMSNLEFTGKGTGGSKDSSTISTTCGGGGGGGGGYGGVGGNGYVGGGGGGGYGSKGGDGLNSFNFGAGGGGGGYGGDGGDGNSRCGGGGGGYGPYGKGGSGDGCAGGIAAGGSGHGGTGGPGIVILNYKKYVLG